MSGVECSALCGRNVDFNYTDRIEAVEMWIWRRLEKISWTDKVSTEDILRTVSESRSIWQWKHR